MSDSTPEERRWSIAIERADFGVWDLDPGLELVHYSPQWKARLGFPRVDAPDSSAFWRCRVHPADVDPMLRALRSHLDGFTAAYAVQFRLRGNGSGYRSMLSRGRVVARNDRGDATRMIGTMLDLTGRPPSAANYGLAIERSARPQDLHRQPFHAVLGGTAEAAVAGRAAGSPRPSQGLVELVDDLLDAALRDAKGAA